jgi:hypothetical protein
MVQRSIKVILCTCFSRTTLPHVIYFKPTLISVAKEMIRTGFVGLSAEVSNSSFLPRSLLCCRWCETLNSLTNRT